MLDNDRFLTVGELLERWNMDARTLGKLIEAGQLSYVDYPDPVRVRRFPLSVVKEFEQKHLHMEGTTNG